ncbi:hypothetical protein [Ornithinimicrobium cavernae]|nr:hypothetical protein [Ornithinimicrobium cavernae]
MAEQESPRRRPASRGRPDDHDPTGGIGGATPAHSPVTLRMEPG